MKHILQKRKHLHHKLSLWRRLSQTPVRGLTLFLFLFGLTAGGKPSAEKPSVTKSIEKYSATLSYNDNEQMGTEDRSLIEVLSELSEKHRVYFDFEKKVLEGKTVTREYEGNDEKALERFLKDILTPHNLTFEKLDGNYLIYPKRKKKQAPEKNAKTNASSTGNTLRREEDFPDKISPIRNKQERTITGKVTDENGDPLQGATIRVKDQRGIGTVTDIKGNYVITLPDNVTTLIFSFVGFLSQEIEVTTRSTVDVILLADLTALKEVAVVSTGYYEVEQKLNPGNIARVDAKIIEKQPVVNPLQTIQGRVAGVQIQPASGIPGGELNINIRGVNSLNNGQELDDGTELPNSNRPFFIIDGVPFINETVNGTDNNGLPISRALGNGNPLAFIQPSDIESIEVLKDADATAIYGSRGANGVIIITTKKGAAGKTRVNINYSQGWGEVPRKLALLGTEDYLLIREEGLRNDGRTPSELRDPDLLLWDRDRNTDWQEELLSDVADQTNASFSVSGGKGQTQFSFSGAYFSQGNVYNYDDSKFERFSGTITLNHRSLDRKLGIYLSVNYANSINNQGGITPASLVLRLASNAPALFDDSGNLNWENGTWNNPLGILERRYENNTKNLVVNSKLSYGILDNLVFSTSIGLTNTITDEVNLIPIATFNPEQNRIGSATIGNGNAETFIIEPQLSYDQEIGQGRISVLLGATLQGSDANREAVLASGYQNDALLGDLSAAGSIRSQGTSDNQYRYSAIFTRLNYTWAGKYILNLTGRRDGSSRFGPGQQFGNFGAIGAAWLFSEEKVIANLLPLLSFGKLRASYGVVGNDQIGDYQYLSSYSPVDPYNENQSITPTRAANPEYSWETTRKLEFGLELGFFDDRMRLNSSWYRNRTFDQLIGRPLSATTGYNSQQFNLPATVENRGWEFELTTVNVVSGEFRWRSDFNLSFPENELLEFENIEAFPEFDAFYEVGRPILGRKEFQSLGVNPETGTYDFVDFNRDGVIDVSDRQFFVANVQEFYGGLENSFSYKGLQLDFHLFFVKQEAIDFTVSNFSSSARGGGFVPTTRVLERWQNPGDVTDLPRTSERLGTSNRRNIPNARVDASFIRLQNVSLSWQLPPAWTAAARIENARIYLQGQNLLTITDYDGWDPETQNMNLPQLRMITTGIQLTF